MGDVLFFGHQTMFDGVWSPNIYRLARPYKGLDSHVSNMFDAGMRTTLAQRLVSIV